MKVLCQRYRLLELLFENFFLLLDDFEPGKLGLRHFDSLRFCALLAIRLAERTLALISEQSSLPDLESPQSTTEKKPRQDLGDSEFRLTQLCLLLHLNTLL